MPEVFLPIVCGWAKTKEQTATIKILKHNKNMSLFMIDLLSMIDLYNEKFDITIKILCQKGIYGSF